MKIALDTVLTNLDDTPAEEAGKPVTVKTVLIRAILTDIDDNNQPIKGDEKIKRYDLYRKVKKADNETDFEVEEVATMRKASLVFSTLVAGQIREALSG